MNSIVGGLVTLIGLFNLVYLGVMGKTFGVWSRTAQESNPKLYRVSRIISGGILALIGVLMMLNLFPN